MKLTLVNFCDLNEDEALEVLEWRNSVKEWMFDSSTIDKKRHFEFIKSLKTSKNYYFVAKDGDEALGVVSIKSDRSIGIYAKPNSRGVGWRLLEAIVWYGFYVLKYEDLFVLVFINNTKAIRLYEKFGFKRVNSHIEGTIKMELCR